MVPRSLQVKVDKIENLTEYEQPLKVSYEVTGTLGTHTGKRVILPSDIFLSGESATFADEKRQEAVYFQYPRYVQDAQRLNLPGTMSVEATADYGEVRSSEAGDLYLVGRRRRQRVYDATEPHSG